MSRRTGRLLLFLIGSIFCVSTTTAQNNLDVAYLSAANSPDFINICGAPDQITVRVSLAGTSSAARTQISARALLFPGVSLVEFLPGGSSAGVELLDASNPAQPLFQLPDLAPGATTFADLSFTITADCGYTDTLALNDELLVFDRYQFDYELLGNPLSETDATNEYRDAFAFPFLTINVLNDNPPLAVNDCFSREVYITNSALSGFTDTLVYTLEQAAGASLQNLSIGGNALPFTLATNAFGDTIYTAIIDGDAFGTNELFEPDETVVLTEELCFTECYVSTASTHRAGWGCGTTICREATALDQAPLGEGVPNVLFTDSGTDDNAGYCETGTKTISYTNSGIEFAPGFGTMFDVATGIGLGSTFATSSDDFSITQIRIAGVVLDDLTALAELDQHPQFSTDPDGPGGLTDQDNDGFFDDLPVGESIEISVDYEFSCADLDENDPAEDCTNDRAVAFNARLDYTDACTERITTIEPVIHRPSNVNTNTENFTDTDALLAADTFSIVHTESRSIRDFATSCNGDALFSVELELSDGILALPDLATLSKNEVIQLTLVNSSLTGNLLRLEYNADLQFLNGDYRLEIPMTTTCDAAPGPTSFPLTFSYSCSDCACEHLWYCGTLDGPVLHPNAPPCAPLVCEEGLQTTEFEVNRTSFGFTDGTYSTMIDPEDANRQVALACDEVEMRVTSIVGNTPVSDQIGVRIRYGNPDETDDPAQIFEYLNGEVRLVIGGQESFCSVDASALSVDVANNGDKILNFDLSNCLTDNGLTLTAGDEVAFIGNFRIDENGPYTTQFREVPDFRAEGYAIVNGTEASCDNYGEQFTLARAVTAFDAPSSSDFPTGCSDAPLEYRLITINNGFNQFFPGEFRPATRVDSFRFTFDPALLTAFDDRSVQVSFPGHPVFGNDFYDLPPLDAFPNGQYSVRFDTLSQFPSLNVVQTFSFNLRVQLTPSCNSIAGSSNNNNLFDLSPTIFWQDRVYACADDRTDGSPAQLAYTDPPLLSLTNSGNPNVQLTGDTAVWSVQLCNLSTESEAGQTFVALEVPANMTITEIIDPTTGQVLDSTPYTEGIFVLTDGLASATLGNGFDEVCNRLTIRATVQTCGNFSVPVRAGWSCQLLDTATFSPEEYAPCPTEELQLSLETVEPFLEAEVSEQATGNPELCEENQVEILLRNTDLGAAFDLRSRIVLPTGASLVPGSVEFAYPSNNGFTALPDPILATMTMQGAVYEYSDLENFGQLATSGLPGFAIDGSNELRLRFRYVTACDFRSGSQLRYNFRGLAGCGSPTNFEAGETLPLFLAGTQTLPVSQLFEVNFGSNEVLVPASQTRLTLNATNLTPDATDATSVLSLILPNDITYVAGSSAPIAPQGYDPGAPDIMTTNGLTELRWPIPAGLAQGETASLEIFVNVPDYDCGADPIGFTLQTLTLRELTCANTNQPCEIATINSTTGTDLSFLPVGGSVVNQNDQVTAVCLNPTQELVTVSGALGSATDLSATEYVFTYYFDENNNGSVQVGEALLAQFTEIGAISPGSPLDYEHNFATTPTQLCALLLVVESASGNVCGSLISELPVPQLQNSGEDATACLQNGETYTAQLGNEDACPSAAAYTYEWTAIAPATIADLSATDSPMPQLNRVFSGTTDTLRYVLETTRPGCASTTDTTTIILTPQIELLQPDPIAIVSGSSTDLEAVILSGEGPFIYSWTPLAGLTGANEAVATVTPTETTTYTLEVSNEFGCTATAEYLVILDNPIVGTVSTSDTTICAQNEVLIVIGGGNNFVFNSDPANPDTDNLNLDNVPNVIFSNGLPGESYHYSVIVRNDAFPGFADTVAFSVTIFEEILVEIAPVDTICSGDQLQLTATAPQGIDFVWTPTPLFGQNTPDPIVRPSVTTTYTVAVTDANGCITERSILVPVENCDLPCEPATVLGTEVSASRCELSIGSARVDLVESPADYLYLWTPNVGVSAGFGNLRTQLPSGTYSVEIINQNNADCSVTATLFVPNEDAATATAATTPADCGVANGTATLSPSDFEFLWPDGSTENTRNDLGAGSYEVSITDPAQPDCPGTLTVLIEESNDLITTIQIDQQPDCGVANGQVTILVEGGSGDYSFSWQNPNDNTQGNLAAGTYNITVNDQNSGCSTVATFVLTENVAQVLVTPTDTTDVSCFGASDGAIAFEVAYPADFAFPADTVITNGFDNFAAIGLSGGTYCVEIRDANGCLAGGVCFSVEEPLPLEAEVITTQSCGTGGSISVSISGGSEPYQYDWADLPGTDDPASRSELPAGTYDLTVTDANGCPLPLDMLTVAPCTDCDFSVDGDSLLLQAENCDALTPVCIDISNDALPNFVITDNGSIYTEPLDICAFDTIGVYTYATLTNDGPYLLFDWTVNGTTFSGPFATVPDLVDSMNVWDPNGNWTLSPMGPFITGGNPGSVYQNMQVQSTATGVVSILGYNPQFLPVNFALQLPVGTHEIILTDTVGGCVDTLFADIRCTTTEVLTETVVVGTSDTLCLSGSELVGPPDTLFNTCPDGSFVEYAVLNDSCVILTGLAIGTETACLVLCDTFGFCDTTLVNIDVVPPPQTGLVDTIVVDQTTTVCLDTLSFLNLPGNVISATNLCPTQGNGNVEFTLDDLCLTYTGLAVGAGNACIELCDDTGACQTVEVDVTVLPGELVLDTIPVGGDPVLFCMNLSSLTGDTIVFTNTCPEEGGESVLFTLNETTGCMIYEGIAPGVDTACILVTDELGNVVLYNFFIDARQPVPNTVIDTIFIAEDALYCLDTSELLGPISFVEEICPDETLGLVDFFINPQTNCVEYTGLEIGKDTACLRFCDDGGFCDTTYFCVVVEEFFEPPIANNDTVQTQRNTPVIIDIKGNDLIFGGIDTAYILDDGNGPFAGTVFINPDCSVTYNPNEQNCDFTDQFTYVICNSIGCDTARVLVEVSCTGVVVFTAVSPNNDGKNDFFYIANIEDFPDNTLQIFNRWGNLVFETEEYENDWNGTYGGSRNLPDGTYFYLLRWIDNGVEFERRGSLTIFR